jgi:hypothetical protein
MLNHHAGITVLCHVKKNGGLTEQRHPRPQHCPHDMATLLARLKLEELKKS